MTQDETRIRKLAEAGLLEHARNDAAFRELLLKDPRQAFKEEFGVVFPPSVRVQAIEEPANTLIVVVPAKPVMAGSLSDDQLEAVSGGVVRSGEAQIYQALSSAISVIMKNFGGALNTAARGG